MSAATSAAETIPDEPTPAEELEPRTIAVPEPRVIEITPEMVVAPTLGLPTRDEWQVLVGIANNLAESGVLGKRLDGRPKAVLAVVLKGRELGLNPMTACSAIHIIEGVPTLSAHLMLALIRRQGHEVWYEETTDDRAVLLGQRRRFDGSLGRETRVEWTKQMAAAANLLGKDNWKHYRPAMLRSRAATTLVRMEFSDVLMGAWYDPSELGARVDAQGNVVALPSRREAQAAAATLRQEGEREGGEGADGAPQDRIPGDERLPQPDPDTIDGQVEPEETLGEDLDRDALWLELGAQAAAMGQTVVKWTTRWVAHHKKNAADASAHELKDLVESRRDIVTAKVTEDVAAAERMAAYIDEHAPEPDPAETPPGEAVEAVAEPADGPAGGPAAEPETPAEGATEPAEELFVLAEAGQPAAGVEDPETFGHPFKGLPQDPEKCDLPGCGLAPDDPIHKP